MGREDILKRWDITAEELAEIVDASPSMRGLVLGYVAEYKLRKMFFERDPRTADVTKYHSHDSKKPGDVAFAYRGVPIVVLCQSCNDGYCTPRGQETARPGERTGRDFS